MKKTLEDVVGRCISKQVPLKTEKTSMEPVVDIYKSNEDGFRYSFYKHVIFGYTVLRILSSDGIEIDPVVKRICDKIDDIMNVDRREKINGRFLWRDCDRIRRNPFTVRRMKSLASLYGELYDLLWDDKRCRSYGFLAPVSNSAGVANLSGVLYAIREWLEWRSHRNWIALLWSRIKK